MASASNHYSRNYHLPLHSQNPNPSNPNPYPYHNPIPSPNSDTEDRNPIPIRIRGDSSDMAEPSGNNNNNNNVVSSSSSSSDAAAAAMAMSMSISIDGSEEDLVLSRSEFLTRQEVLKRRSRRVKQLSKIYRDHYWSLMEELKLKHREYYWEYGKSPFQEDEDSRENLSRRNNSALGTNAEGNQNNGKLALGLEMGANGNSNRCEVHGCKMKAMALTRFCHSHILSDAKQKLYKGCTYVTKSSPTGPTLCMKPILRSTVPSVCPLHLQKAEKHVTRALRKAGLNCTSTCKLAPEFHVIVTEYVRQIQFKRRAAHKALVDTVESKEGNNI
ncbi:hypothetical protein U1Q18_014538 [Sarracenia purpurea var. burkii]